MPVKFFCSVCIIMIACSAVNAAGMVTESADIDGIRYTVISDRKGSVKETEILHPVFSAAAEQIYAEYNVKRPPFFDVTIICGAGLFKTYTGCGEHTAGLFIAERNVFVFQRPSALNKKGILDNTVRHELLHSAVYNAMSDQMRTLHPRGDESINEAFCTALYPAGSYNPASGAKAIAECGDEQKIKKYLADAYRSENKQIINKAADAAYFWGLQLIKKHGKRQTFNKAAMLE